MVLTEENKKSVFKEVEEYRIKDKQQTPNARIAISSYDKKTGNYKTATKRIITDEKTGEKRKVNGWVHIMDLDPTNAEDSYILKNCNQLEQLKSMVLFELDVINTDERLKDKSRKITDKETLKYGLEKLKQKLTDAGICFRVKRTEDFRAIIIITFWKKIGTFERNQRYKFRQDLFNYFSWKEKNILFDCDKAFSTDKHLFSIGIHPKTNKEIIIDSENNFNKYNDEEQILKLIKPKIESCISQNKQYIKNINDFYDNVLIFHEHQPFFYDENGLYWVWDKIFYRYEITDEITLINKIEDLMLEKGQIRNSIKREYINFIQQIGRKKKPAELEGDFIQFKDKIYNLKTNEEFKATPLLLSLNPIPYAVGESEETPKIDKLFSDWMNTPNKKQTEKEIENKKNKLYEILAYCCINSYPLHKIFILIGKGSNGKGVFMNIMSKFLTKKNICSSELDYLMKNRFETSKLYKKLVCQIGETNFNKISNTSLLKRLSGGDLINYEIKNKNPFDDYNYAKVIIATNTLPATTDRTDGFYRRMDITKFENQFTREKDVLGEIPKEEYNNLAKKCLRLAKKLITERVFSIELSIDQQRAEYEANSNPIGQFIKEECILNNNEKIQAGELYESINQYMRESGHRKHSNIEIRRILEAEGFYTKQIYEYKNKTCWIGITTKKKKKYIEKMQQYQTKEDQRPKIRQEELVV